MVDPFFSYSFYVLFTYFFKEYEMLHKNPILKWEMLVLDYTVEKVLNSKHSTTYHKRRKNFTHTGTILYIYDYIYLYRLYMYHICTTQIQLKSFYFPGTGKKQKKSTRNGTIKPKTLSKF